MPIFSPELNNCTHLELNMSDDLNRLKQLAGTLTEDHGTNAGALAGYIASLIPEGSTINGTPIRVGGFGDRGLILDLLDEEGDAVQSWTVTFHGNGR